MHILAYGTREIVIRKLGVVLKLRRHVSIDLLTLILVLGCDLPEQPKVVTITNAPIFQPLSPKDVHSIEQALAAIITVCRRDPGLVVVDPLSVYLHKNTLSFQINIRGWNSLPVNIANIVAVAHANTIHVNLEKAGANESVSKMWLLAHEYGHNVQNARKPIKGRSLVYRRSR